MNTSNQIVLTTGMFDLLKAQITRKKLNIQNEKRILAELRNAKQVLRKDLPTGFVDVYKSVTITDVETKTEHTYHFVPKNVARRKHGTLSILSDLGLALLGHKSGAEIPWATKDGEKIYRIEKVADIDS